MTGYGYGVVGIILAILGSLGLMEYNENISTDVRINQEANLTVIDHLCAIDAQGINYISESNIVHYDVYSYLKITSDANILATIYTNYTIGNDTYKVDIHFSELIYIHNTTKIYAIEYDYFTNIIFYDCEIYNTSIAIESLHASFN